MADKTNGHGLVLDGFTGKPFSEPIADQFDGAEILNRVKDYVQHYVHLSDQQARIAAAWAAHTHAITAATTTPYLAINSATKQSGKTRLLEVFELIVNKPWLTGRVTAACLVRKVNQVRPTLLLDESDAAFNGEKEYAEALRGILNTGFYAGGVAPCCVGQGSNITYKDFKTFCCKAIAGLGALPDRVADRSIPIRLQRKKPGETVARFRRRYAKVQATDLKSALSNWMTSVADHLREAEPNLPDELTDRQQDGMEPLLAIADAAGGDWPTAVRAAAAEIFRSQAAEDQNIGVQLLADIRAIFEATTTDKITTTDLLEKLKEIEVAPWADWSKGKGLSPNGLARLLKPFGVAPRQVRMEDKTQKGYLWESFGDAFSRYLPSRAPEADSQPKQAKHSASLLNETHIFEPKQKQNVSVAKSASNSHEQCIVSDVSVANPPREGGDTKKPELILPCPVHGRHADWWIRLLPGGGDTVCGKCEPEQPPAMESLLGDTARHRSTRIDDSECQQFGSRPPGRCSAIAAHDRCSPLPGDER